MSQHPIEAMKQALEALEQDNPLGRSATITALRAAIAEVEKQEPVACRTLCELCVKRGYDFCANAAKTTPIITTPPAAQRQWVGLTEKDFSAINQSCLTKLQAATSAESILKEKNT